MYIILVCGLASNYEYSWFFLVELKFQLLGAIPNSLNRHRGLILSRGNAYEVVGIHSTENILPFEFF